MGVGVPLMVSLSNHPHPVHPYEARLHGAVLQWPPSCSAP